MSTERFYIWDFERNQFWLPAQVGYTSFVNEAGRYPFERAIEIAQDANKYQGTWRKPNTAIIPVKDYGFNHGKANQRQ